MRLWPYQRVIAELLPSRGWSGVALVKRVLVGALAVRG
jgi:hypothetical protein